MLLMRHRLCLSICGIHVHSMHAVACCISSCSIRNLLYRMLCHELAMPRCSMSAFRLSFVSISQHCSIKSWRLKWHLIYSMYKQQAMQATAVCLPANTAGTAQGRCEWQSGGLGCPAGGRSGHATPWPGVRPPASMHLGCGLASFPVKRTSELYGSTPCGWPV